MANTLSGFQLDMVSEIQKEIMDRTAYLNDNDVVNINTFIAHWLLAEVTFIKMKGVNNDKE